MNKEALKDTVLDLDNVLDFLKKSGAFDRDVKQNEQFINLLKNYVLVSVNEWSNMVRESERYHVEYNKLRKIITDQVNIDIRAAYESKLESLKNKLRESEDSVSRLSHLNSDLMDEKEEIKKKYESMCAGLTLSVILNTALATIITIAMIL